MGTKPSILAPYDPDDALLRRLHRGARPQRLEPPANFVSLGRTIGVPANGAVSNLTGLPTAILASAASPARRRLRRSPHPRADRPHDRLRRADVQRRACPWSAPSTPTPPTPISNGIGALVIDGRRRMNRLHVRIAVSEAAAWTARRFYGGRYRIVPNGVLLDPTADEEHPNLSAPGSSFAGLGETRLIADKHEHDPLAILFIGQAVERKGLPVLLRAFEALREHVPATLTLVGASPAEIAPHAARRPRRARARARSPRSDKQRELRRAEVLCAPSLARRELRDGAHRGLRCLHARRRVRHPRLPRRRARRSRRPARPARRRARARRGAAHAGARPRAPGRDGRRRPRACRALLLDARRRGGPRRATSRPSPSSAPATAIARIAVRHGFAPADLRPRVRARRLPSLEPAPPPRRRALRVLSRLATLALTSLVGLALAYLALQKIGVTNVAASLVASSPGLVAAGVGVMCASMFVRGLAWHAILKAAPTWRTARRRDALQGTFIGVLMSATLPARLGEPSRALIVARRVGRARETLPVVLGTMVSQTLLNLLALAILGGVTLSSVSFAGNHTSALLAVALAPLAVLLVLLMAPVLVPARRRIALRAPRAPAHERARRARSRTGRACASFATPARPSSATLLQLSAWGLQWLSCWLLLMALGLDNKAGSRRRRRRPLRGQRHRRNPRHARQRRRLPGRLRRGSRRRLPRPHGRRAGLRDRVAGRRGRHRRHHGHARARRRGTLLERRPPAHHARLAGEAAAAAGQPRRAPSRVRS